MKEGGKDSEPKSVEIRFGMVFARWFEKKCSIYVVIDVGKSNWFETSAMMQVNGKVAFCLPGTAAPEYVNLVLGQLTKEQILEGYDNWYEEPTPKIIVDEINKNAAKPPRTINY